MLSAPAALLLTCALTAGADLRVDPPALHLRRPGARHTLLLDERRPDAAPLDRTRDATYRSLDPAVARVDERGTVSAVRDGQTTIQVRHAGVTLAVPVRVEGSATPRTFNFENDIVPLLSRHACNASGCHGKAEGQNGFKLSVFGFDPAADHAALVMEGRGRRLLPAAPELSLLLTKASGVVAHGGGKRLEPGSDDHETLRAWIAAGAPFGSPADPRVVSVRVEPRDRLLAPRGRQQLRVIARTSDGRDLDVTAHARFASNNDALLSVDETGLVRAGDVPGGAAVMVGYQNAVDTFRALVPRQEAVKDYPKVPAHNFLDRLVHDRLRKLQIVPSGVCDDATFLRRAHLDVIGTLPTPAEARAFLGDTRPDRRERLVDALLERPEFADYWALKWADLLRVDRAALGPKLARGYHAWLRRSFAAGVGFDRLARDLVSAEGPLDENPPASLYAATGKPGTTGSTIAQVFLGVRIACAECHHHPSDRWSQDDYFGFTAYFSPVSVRRTPAAPGREAPAGELVAAGPASARNPRSGETVWARPLGGTPPAKPEPGDRRPELAAWLTDAKNPYFARNFANRVWAHFLGRGLVEPVDDIRDTNPPSNPKLLDALADHARETKYDLRALIRTITRSRTYQLASAPNATNASDTQNYSRALFKRLPAEVLLDMVAQTTGVPERFRGLPPGTRAIQLWDSKVPHYFLEAFGRPKRTTACECERNPEPGVAQVLHLLNAPEIEARIGHAAGTVARLLKAHADDDRVVEELYLTFFARRPDAKERQTALAHLAADRARRREAAEDLAWGLMNTLEFVFNH